MSWLVLSQLSSIKPNKWVQLSEQHNLTIDELCRLPSDDWLTIGIHPSIVEKRSKATHLAELAIHFLSKNSDVQCTYYSASDYPQSLRLLSHPPAVLFIRGNNSNLHDRQLAIVGSRHASKNGQYTAKSFAQDVAEQGIVITSGLARGIDSQAHLGALNASNGRTIAVLGCGIDICYPKYNQGLFDKIIQRNGTVVSEFLPNTPPRPHHFPCRNRIVAMLSTGVLLVEAKIRSGSLITCNLAADMGKDVFAVPGNINHPLSEGANWLIQQGAKLITSSADILNEFNVYTVAEEKPDSKRKGLAIDPILDSVDYDVTPLYEIIKRSKLSSSDVLTALLEHELQGLVTAVPGGYLKLRGE
nr:DNA-processing protein DprA [Alteromonas sp. 5E99-2]